MRTNLHGLAIAVLALALAAPARASTALGSRDPGRVSVTASLGGGGELGSSSNEVGEMELTVGYEFPHVRPELGLVLGLAPDEYAAIRAGAHADLANSPLYGRAALDFSNVRDDWKLRWVLLGAGAEGRLTSEMGAFVEADVGLPMASRFGLALLVRAGFSLRF